VCFVLFVVKNKRLNHEGHKEHEVKFDKISNKVIGCAIEVHRSLCPSLLESTYE